jgi:hypothetical protein
VQVQRRNLQGSWRLLGTTDTADSGLWPCIAAAWSAAAAAAAGPADAVCAMVAAYR